PRSATRGLGPADGVQQVVADPGHGGEAADQGLDLAVEVPGMRLLRGIGSGGDRAAVAPRPTVAQRPGEARVGEVDGPGLLAEARWRLGGCVDISVRLLQLAEVRLAALRRRPRPAPRCRRAVAEPVLGGRLPVVRPVRAELSD